MTAINAILHDDAAHLITDGAAFEGKAFRWQTTKFFPLPHLDAAVAVSGTVIHAPLFAGVLGLAAEDYDGLKLRAVDAIRDAEQSYSPLLNKMTRPVFVVVVAGISGQDGPDAYAVTNDPCIGRTYEVQQCGPLATVPGDAAFQGEFAQAFPGIASGNDLDPVSDGLRILDMQRKRTAWGIGAFAQLTTIRRDGITNRIIRRYDHTPSLSIPLA